MTDTDSSSTDPMAAARRLLGTETSTDLDTATDTDSSAVGTDTTVEATEGVNEDELLE